MPSEPPDQPRAARKALDEHRYYKPVVSIVLGLVGFATSFAPLHISVPPYQATMVLGLTFPMLVALAWGWRCALISLTFGLGGQAMWFLWLPTNGWAPFVAVPFFNLWILWHGWAAHSNHRWARSIYRAEIPFRLVNTVVLYTLFRWALRFNPSPWGPSALTTAPLDFVHFVAFKQLAEGFIVLLLADVLLHTRTLRRVLRLEDEPRVNMSAIIAAFALFGLGYWFVAGVADTVLAEQTLEFYRENPNPSLADTLVLQIPPVTALGRAALFFTALFGGLMVAKYANRYEKSRLDLADSEERYRLIFNAPRDAIFVHDADTGRILDVNRAMEEMYGFPREQVLRSPPTLFSVDDEAFGPKQATSLLHRAVREGPQTFEWLAKNSAGEKFWVDVSLRYTEAGARRFVIAVVRDIQARKAEAAERARLEEALQQSQKMEAIGTLAGGIAHDFNNILAAIMGYAELAKLNLAGRRLSLSELDAVIAASHRARELVLQILTFSRRTDPALTPIDPREVVRESIKLLRASIPSSVVFELDIDCTDRILADPGKLQQIVVNLCTNALQAMGDRGVLRIELQRSEIDEHEAERMVGGRTGKFVELIVSDTGCGMDEATMRRVFEPYFTTKGSGGGTGLGLSTVHGIVQSMGGFVHANSEPGKGSTFSVFFPPYVGEVGDKSGKASANPDEDPPLRGHERILFVDDEPAIVDFMRLTLESLGYTVNATVSATEALRVLEANQDSFDLLLTDQTMPEMSGDELVQRALTLRPDLPVILCTGHSNTVNESTARAMGIRKFLLKPYELATIARAIREAVDAPQS